MARGYNLGRRPLMEIEWRDSLTVDGPQWWTLEEVQAEPCADVMVSSGYIVKETRHWVWLAGDVHRRPDGSISKVGRLFLIPTGCIVRRRRR